MARKGFQEMLAEANAVVGAVSVHDALGLVGADGVIFVDVRDSEERAEGRIPGSIHAPRGFLEFMADPEGPAYLPALTPDKQLVVYCGSGGRSTLATKTLMDMGYGRATNLVGGIQAWSQAGGEIET